MLEVDARDESTVTEPAEQEEGAGLSVFSDDIAIDLGTANTLVHVVGRGVVIDEPSIVAVRSRGGSREVLAVGQKAKALARRGPESVETLRPMRDGVIADFVATEEMLRQFIRRAKTMLGLRRPRILICVPAGATPVERRAVYDTAISAGARQVHIIEEPVAAALGAGLALEDAVGSMVVDVGGGTTDIAVLSRGEVVEARSIRCAGNAMDEAIVAYVRRKHRLLLGEASAERIKIEAGSAMHSKGAPALEIRIRGRDLKEGRMKGVVLTTNDVADALAEPVAKISDFIQRTLEEQAPEISRDICQRGIHLTGGGALLAKFDLELARRLGIKVHVPPNPMHCVVKGSAAILDRLPHYEHLLVRV
jgi:rod shape-determining protein MreB